MSKLNWRAAAHAELALLLKQARLDGSRAVGASTVYQLHLQGRDVLAIALTDGQAILVEVQAQPKSNRRRVSPPME